MLLLRYQSNHEHYCHQYHQHLYHHLHLLHHLHPHQQHPRKDLHATGNVCIANTTAVYFLGLEKLYVCAEALQNPSHKQVWESGCISLIDLYKGVQTTNWQEYRAKPFTPLIVHPKYMRVQEANTKSIRIKNYMRAFTRYPRCIRHKMVLCAA